MTLTLDFLPQTAFAFLLIFARVGSMSMSLPGFGDRAVPPRIRLVLALALTLILYPGVQQSLPAFPATFAGIITALIGELLIGLGIGLSVRLIVSGILVAGSMISVQTGLAMAQTVDPSQGTMGTLFGTFLSVLSITMIFTMDLHHVLLGAMHDSYGLFPPGELLPSAGADFAKLALAKISNAFRLAVQLAAPFLIFGLIFYLGVGVLSRLIPQVQIFFVVMPANIMLGFALFMLLLSTITLWYMDYFGQAIQSYLL